jgi:hypothetical protein
MIVVSIEENQKSTKELYMEWKEKYSKYIHNKD